MRNVFICAMITLGAQSLCAQSNLVPNGGFEDHMECPGQTGLSVQMTVNCIGWVTPTQGSPDYFSTCATNFAANTVGNVFGPQPPHSGEAYIGSYMFSYFQPELREYAQVQLLEPIAPGIRYLVGFYVSRADSVLFSVNTIGAHFSTTPIGSNDVWVLPVEPDIVNAHTDSLIDSNIWYHITDTFVSRVGGGERYLTIGNFSVAAESDTHLVRPPLQISFSAAYYYIDDVSVIALDSASSVSETAAIGLSVYPNPARESLRLDVSGLRLKNMGVTVSDMLGRTLINLKPETLNHELNIAHLPPGLYTVVAQTQDGRVARQRVVKVEGP